MRIPLDYYRILGLPIQATAEQLETAHRDRTQQLPRREYSEYAIEKRKQLLDVAYEVLRVPDSRREYDASFLTDLPADDQSVSTSVEVEDEPKLQTPSIEISESQLVGALLIGLELGEYELVLKLGRAHLSSPKSDRSSDQDASAQLERADIVLTIALACLELGREQWQQGTYTKAAESLETGQKLLLSEGLFPTVRGEITADIYKLRPYRILELLSQPEEKAIMRRQGVQMLRDMLQERGGIDSSGDDGSGLGIDDFLRFIQQLRGHMTSQEQQSLFESEALRPSAVATYLAVYALLARGFAQFKPAMITRAKRMLMRLGSRQDVHLEQAVCALLLGQTEQASRALELSQEYEAIALIREHSQGAQDLLPGLCLYSESWLHNEVFPHFRDLQNSRTTLKEYFANEEVQAYLEALPQEANDESEWTVLQHQPLNRTKAGGDPSPTVGDARPTAGGDAVEKPAAEAVGTQTMTETSQSAPQGRGGRPPEDLRQNVVGSQLHPVRKISKAPAPMPADKKDEKLPGDRLGMLKLAAIGILALGLLWLVVGWLLKLLFAPKPVLEGEQLLLRLDRAPIEIPDPSRQLGLASSLSKETASMVINSWLSTKRQVFGPNHRIDRLDQILTEPALSVQRQRALAARQENWHGQYQHRITVNSVQMGKSDPNQAIVEATIGEKAEFIANGQLDRASSYSDPNLRLRYELIRKNDRWLIKQIRLLN